MRLVIAILFGAALAVTLPISGMHRDAVAKAAKSKACAATSMDSKKVTWKCKASEKCCFDAVMGKGTCTEASSMCL